MSSSRLVSPLLVLFSAASPDAGASPIYLAGDSAAGFWTVDADSGDRQLADIDDYPHIILSGDCAVEGPGSLLFEVTTALQHRALHRVALPGLATQPISGNYPGDESGVIGSGPSLDPALLGLLATGAGDLLALHTSGEVMRIDLASGDRTVVSRSASPALGAGVDIGAALDLALLSSAELAVADQFETLVRVDLMSGDRSHLVPPGTFAESPQRIDTLPGERLVHCLASGGATIWVLDPASPPSAPLSSAVYGAGGGPAFVALVDLHVSEQGRLFALDVGLAAVFEIDPATGDRRILSGGPEEIGTGPELPTALDHPLFATRPGLWPRAPAGIHLR